ncbi:uncharacterized protein [Heterodontus francisci]|uniref:uncharacterized protein n=1 Tax=Heterodontus francisci TaxID=7792 RepID=UPI00355BFF93
MQGFLQPPPAGPPTSRPRAPIGRAPRPSESFPPPFAADWLASPHSPKASILLVRGGNRPRAQQIGCRRRHSDEDPPSPGPRQPASRPLNHPVSDWWSGASVRRDGTEAETVGSRDGEEARDDCQVRSKPMLSLPSEVVNPYLRTREQCLEESYFGRLPPICDINTPLETMPYHNKSVEQYTHMKRLGQLPKAPNMLYREPVTISQQYGWWLPRDPKQTLENTEPWTRVVRYPLAHSEMTRYVNSMALTNPMFWLY